jgi:chaperonin GroEL
MQNITFSKEARARMQVGANTVADPVRITMGPKGKMVMIERLGGEPEFTLDGVSVAESIKELKGDVENMAAKKIKKIARKINDLVGDATSTGTTFSQALLNEGLLGVEIGLDAHLIRKAYSDGAEIIIAELKRVSKKVKTKKQMSDIATVSCRDRVMGDIISEIYSKIGAEGHIDVELSTTMDTGYEMVPGTRLEQGWLSPFFITNWDKKESILNNAHVLVTTQTLVEAMDVIPLISMVNETEEKSLIIIAEDVQADALEMLVKNHLAKKVTTMVIRAPGHGELKTQLLQDIAVLTGATVIADKAGSRVEDVSLGMLGKCGKVVTTRSKTVFINGRGSKSGMKKYLKSIKSEIQSEDHVQRKGMLEKRYSSLSGGIAVLRVGYFSDSEVREKLDRIEDAVNATKYGIQEGVVPGGGFASLKASKLLDGLIIATNNHSYRFGLEALQRAIAQPAIQILENAGHKADIILSEINSGRKKGFDANIGEYCDMFAAGIIDPLKAARVCLELSTLEIGHFLVTGAVVANEREVVNE